MAVAWLVGWLYEPADRWVFALAMLVGLVPIARRAFAAARAGVPFSIEMLMSVAAVGAVVIGSAEEAAMVVLLFLVGELLEGVTAERARASIGKLADLVPRHAFVRGVDGRFTETPAAALRVGDVIRVRPGDRIAADGEVVEGVGSVNEAPVTGESVPREKASGDAVFAGTVNGESALLVSVTAAAADNTIARVIRLVEEAQQAKAPMARFIDRFARRYTPAIALLALLTACVPPLLGGGWGEWIYKALALLLIGCPCALVISTPTAIAAGLARGARYGLLMKGGSVLENAGRLGVIAFDKTGTLTEGTPKVTDVIGAGGTDGTAQSEVIELAAALEAGSSHPLALAVLAKAQSVRSAQAGEVAEVSEHVAPFTGRMQDSPLSDVLAEDLRTIAGQGITGRIGGREYFLGSARAAAARAEAAPEMLAQIKALAAEGKTVSVLVEEAAATAGGRVVGVIAMRDELRADAPEAIRRLRAQGVRCVMLTGDTGLTARAIAEKLDMEVRAELLPQDKQQIVTELKAEANAAGRFAGVVGDGINDAPALAAADVGIAMGGGTDVALETADAAILRSNVSDVAAMLNLSKATMRNIYQNIGFALGFKAIFLVTTLLGITGLWPAILADTGATVIVTLNAMRLLRWRAPVA